MTKNKSKIEVAQIHLPDLHFIRYCEREFNVNRGIYNTIDEWFFNFGLKNLLVRRETILYFLQKLNEKRIANNTTKVRFGSGGLTYYLTDFCEKNILET
jgi:riboflavin kinase